LLTEFHLLFQNDVDELLDFSASWTNSR